MAGCHVCEKEVAVRTEPDVVSVEAERGLSEGFSGGVGRARLARVFLALEKDAI